MRVAIGAGAYAEAAAATRPPFSDIAASHLDDAGRLPGVGRAWVRRRPDDYDRDAMGGGTRRAAAKPGRRAGLPPGGRPQRLEHRLVSRAEGRDEHDPDRLR